MQDEYRKLLAGDIDRPATGSDYALFYAFALFDVMLAGVAVWYFYFL